MVYPTNVIHMSTECSNRNHSAAFPIELPTWFIKLFTAEGDVVLDPFVGSGTTTQVAKEMGRNFVGIDINPEYAALAASRVLEPQRRLKEHNEQFEAGRSVLQNKLTGEFIAAFCESTGAIDWTKVVEANSRNLDLDNYLPSQ